MGFEVPVDPGFDGSDSVYVNCPMRAHVAVVDVDEDGTRIGGKNSKGEMVVEFEVLAGSTPGQEGLRHRTYFTKSVQAAWRIHRFAIAAGVITVEEIDKCKTSGQMPRYEFERDCVGRQMFVDIVDNEHNGKVSQKIEGGFFHLTSKSCVDLKRWPRNEAMIKKSGVKMPDPKQSNGASSSPAKPAAEIDLGDVQL